MVEVRRPAPRPPVAVEARRLEALHKYAVLDTAAEDAYDQIVNLAAQLCRTPMAFVSLIDAERQWFKARCGLDATETDRDVAFCAHAILGNETLVVEDTLTDARFYDNPFVVGQPHLRFYAGVPLHSAEGLAVGTLCVADVVPRPLSPHERKALETLAQGVVAHLELRWQLRQVAKLGLELSSERDAVALVEQKKRDLVSSIVHDLKNPLTCVIADAEFIRQQSTPSPVAEAATSMLAAAERMHRMTLDMLDISSSDDGQLHLRSTILDVDTLLEDATRSVLHHAQREGIAIAVQPLTSFQPVRGDRDVLRRVLENLLENAVKYGRGTPVQLSARVACGTLIISVADGGPGVPEAQREAIFERYRRLDRDANHADRTSRGIGLSFCRVALEAHGGSIWVEPNTPTGARFCVALPLGRITASLPALR